MEGPHDLGDALGGHLAQGAEHELACLVLAVREVQLVARPPPAEAQRARQRHHAVGEEVGGKEGAGLTVDARAVVVEDRDLLDICGSACLHVLAPSSCIHNGAMIPRPGSLNVSHGR